MIRFFIAVSYEFGATSKSQFTTYLIFCITTSQKLTANTSKLLPQLSSISVTPPDIANFIASDELISDKTLTLSFFTKYKFPANA